MSTIKIEITLDGTNDAQIIANIVALATGSNATTETAKNLEVKEPEEVKAPEKKAPVKKAAAKKAPEPEPEVEEEDDDLSGNEPGEKEEPAVTKKMLDELLAKKVTINRAAIVAKMQELGAKRLSDLDESQYSEMFDFMSALK